MSSQTAQNFRLTVLNPRGRDRQQQFQNLPGPGEGAHPPINFHAFAACSLGAFHFNQRIRSKRDPATVAFIPTPYPVEDQRWNFFLSPTEQSGIFVGTREWDVPTRNHFTALLVARQLCEATGEPVTVVNLDGYKGHQLLSDLKFPEGKLRLIEKWKSYPDYLRDV